MLTSKGTDEGPSVLVVAVHDDRDSLTWQMARSFTLAVQRATRAGVTTLDLTGDGFDPTFRRADLATYRSRDTSAEVQTYQGMVDTADATVLIFPVYWWSMPAILKGWFDRVFAKGWAYDLDSSGKIYGLLGNLHIRTVALAADTEESFARHGYDRAMATQIDHGIFEYCAVQHHRHHVFYESEDPSGESQRKMLLAADQLGVEVGMHAELAYSAGRGAVDKREK